ncbi:MAG: DUF2029 domain-containing protein [Actinomycetota bacterium]|nr:DUF2029 domain-containing protein [Actinomycetota bacterium]
MILYAVAPLAVLVAVLSASLATGPFLMDFRGGLYDAGKAIIHRDNPYQAEFLHRQAAIQRAGGTPQTVISVPVYPAFALVASVPFTLLPWRVAGVLYCLLSIAAFLAALRLLGVTDWRCYGIAALSWPVLHGFMLGAVTPSLLLGVAVAWRYRQRLVIPAIAVAAIVAIKLFPVALGGWLLATRRYATAALAALFALVAVFGAWAIIGFDGLAAYPHMLSDLAQISEGVSVSLVSGLLKLGIGGQQARAAGLAVSALLIFSAWRLARRPDGDRTAFSLAVIACLTISPMVWPHYLALLFVPIALMSPRLSKLWFAPLLLYVAPLGQVKGNPWEVVPYIAILGLVAGAVIQRARDRRASPQAAT